MGLPDLYIVRTFFIILLLLLVFSPFSVDVDQPIADFFPFFIERISQDTSIAMPVGTSGPQTREFDGHLSHGPNTLQKVGCHKRRSFAACLQQPD